MATTPTSAGVIGIRARSLATRTAESMERAGRPGPPTPPATSRPVVAVLLAWDPVAARACARGLARRLAVVAPSARLVLVDNRSSGMEWAAQEGFEYVSGENSAREFSGLQRGVDHVRATTSPAVWILANDRFGASSEALLDYLSGGTIETTWATGGLVGHINRYPHPVWSLGLEIDSWACSNFVVVADRALTRLEPLVSIGGHELEAIVPSSPRAGGLLTDADPLDRRHRDYMTEWLTGEGTSLGATWYRHRRPDADSWGDLRGKAQSILNEQLLSARARQSGIAVIPIELADRLGRLDPASTEFRLLSAAVRLRPALSCRILKGVAGRNLFAVTALVRARGRRPGATCSS